MVAKGFPLVDIADVNFGERDTYTCQGIADSDTGVRVGPGIDDDVIDSFLACLVYAIDQSAFVIALKRTAPSAMPLRKRFELLIDVGQGLPPVHLWLAGTEQVQVGAMQNEYVLRHCENFVKTDRLFTLKSTICPLNPPKLIYDHNQQQQRTGSGNTLEIGVQGFGMNLAQIRG